MTERAARGTGLGLAVALLGALVWAARVPPPESGMHELAGYMTGMAGRTSGQRRNARLAAAALDGARIAPGAVFSFNARVPAWSRTPGYVRAPVSVEGTITSALGGGVCQTSSTLYNAALLAGLEVVERHPHTVAPRYVPPGRDAAVAYPGIDLRLRNPYPWPVRLAARVAGDRLEVQVLGAGRPSESYRLVNRVVSREPVRAHRLPAAARRRRTVGAVGFRAVTYRVVFRHGREVRRQRLSDDAYATLDAIVPES